ncbi:MAG: NADH-quinone oxidoreductase subunit NuoF [Deltaproteobacteria bacterium]|nr:NADH-quinone oxidoreductase subunit NuoF [Deltaproteobacteria bacterium]
MNATNHLLRTAGAGGDLASLAGYRAGGGFKGLRKALLMSPGDAVETVKKASLRGRGGAGFPAGMKWSFVPPPDGAGDRYLVVNADEGEPGTFKDRHILSRDPFRLIEGCVIAAWAARLTRGFIYVRGEFRQIIRDLERALEAARRAGYLGSRVLGKDFSFDLHVHPGAGAYICGEESALLESIEGKPGRPRLKPPFPAVRGLFGRPTVINNVETLALVPLVFELGPEAFLGLGAERDGGPKLYGVSGHVKRPGLYEFPMGKNLRELIYEDCGGILGDRALKGVIPGGSSCPILLPGEIDLPLTFDSVARAGSMMGTAGAIVIAEGTCMVQVALRIARFYAHESCGQCTPCREGCGWMARTLARIEAGSGQPEHLDLLLELCDQIQGHTICALGDAAAMPVRALVKKYREEFIRHIAEGRCPAASP